MVSTLTAADKHALACMLWEKTVAAYFLRGDHRVHRIVRGLYTVEHTATGLYHAAGIIDWETATISYNERGGLTVDLEGAYGRPIVEALEDPDF